MLFSLGLSLSTAPSAAFANKRNHFINDVKINSVTFHWEPVLTCLLCTHTQSYSLNGSFPPISNNENLDNDKISASIFHSFFLCHLRSEYKKKPVGENQCLACYSPWSWPLQSCWIRRGRLGWLHLQWLDLVHLREGMHMWHPCRLGQKQLPCLWSSHCMVFAKEIKCSNFCRRKYMEIAYTKYSSINTKKTTQNMTMWPTYKDRTKTNQQQPCQI